MATHVVVIPCAATTAEARQEVAGVDEHSAALKLTRLLIGRHREPLVALTDKTASAGGDRQTPIYLDENFDLRLHLFLPSLGTLGTNCLYLL